MKRMCSKRLRHDILGEVGDAAQKSPLPRKIPTIPKPPTMSIEVGSFYEIDHSKLPPAILDVLHSIRMVMVTAKTEVYVTVRYPSEQSLEAYFSNVECVPLRSKMYPALDEKLEMGPKLSSQILGREISSQEFQEQRHSKSFWLINCFEAERHPSPVSVCNDNAANSQAKNGPLFLNLQRGELKGWGYQRVVGYIREPRANQKMTSVSGRDRERSVKEETTSVYQTRGKKSVKKEERHEMEVKDIIQYTGKRKRGRPAGARIKKSKHNPKLQLTEHKPKIKANKEGEYVERWPVKRYETAAKELAEVLKANGAVHGNPISRFELREQARSKIGDTGLLDHLLKHLAGKVVPGGIERLRRRCDSEGKMEYWLESADLVKIRKEAGVQDPYWTPPPGWKPGDCLTTFDCRCGQEVRLLKEELSSMRRQMEELKSKEEDERPITVVQPDNAASSGRVNSHDVKTTTKEMYEALLKKKAVMEEQLLEISKALLELEEDMNMLSNKEAAATAAEVRESDGEETERETQGERTRPMKLKPCRQQDRVSNLSSSQAAENLLALTPTSESPLSTTTS